MELPLDDEVGHQVELPEDVDDEGDPLSVGRKNVCKKPAAKRARRQKNDDGDVPAKEMTSSGQDLLKKIIDLPGMLDAYGGFCALSVAGVVDAW